MFVFFSILDRRSFSRERPCFPGLVIRGVVGNVYLTDQGASNAKLKIRELSDVCGVSGGNGPTLKVSAEKSANWLPTCEPRLKVTSASIRHIEEEVEGPAGRTRRFLITCHQVRWASLCEPRNKRLEANSPVC